MKEENKIKNKKIWYIISVIARCIALVFLMCIGTFFVAIFGMMMPDTWLITLGCVWISLFTILFIIFFPKKNYRKKLIIAGSIVALTLICYSVNLIANKHEEKITINTEKNIDTSLYMPFDENSKIARLDYEPSLKLEGDLPVIDGASAAFPVYSAFCNAVYPEDMHIDEELKQGTFVFFNTLGGYTELARGTTDIFFGAYPSQDQIRQAKTLAGAEFEYTEIAKEAFVFFVNKNNKVDGLTSEQIKKIYSGEITNWKEVGGKNKDIVAYQRIKNSGSQSMFLKFMGDTTPMEAPTEQIQDMMVGIIDVVANYKNTDTAIGYSFRYYLDTIVNNPKVKMLSVDGVYPSYENIKNGTYVITVPVYAVTVKGNTNENVKKLIDWILSDEGQELIEKSGYAGIK